LAARWKIDRSFISGLPRDRASMTLTRTIISLASAFGLLTVAEGVETSEQFELLRMLNCGAQWKQPCEWHRVGA
jgi:EAL domain-containing protein (putative c-di-GMP-specific phosphodiesterase class I)